MLQARENEARQHPMIRKAQELFGTAPKDIKIEVICMGFQHEYWQTVRLGTEKAAKLIEEAGGRAIPLKVAGAFHSPLMKPSSCVPVICMACWIPQPIDAPSAPSNNMPLPSNTLGMKNSSP